MLKSNTQFPDEKGQDAVGNMTQQSVLNAFDFSAIEEMDPSLGKYEYKFGLKRCKAEDIDEK